MDGDLKLLHDAAGTLERGSRVFFAEMASGVVVGQARQRYKAPYLKTSDMYFDGNVSGVALKRNSSSFRSWPKVPKIGLTAVQVSSHRI